MTALGSASPGGCSALVTGAAGGVGSAVVWALVARGAHVTIADRNLDAAVSLERRVAAGGGCADARALDVSDLAAVDALLDELAQRRGRLDCACNCAGVTGVRAPLVDQPPGVFRRVMAVNAEGVFNCLRAELRTMGSQGAGAIVNVASGAASFGVAGSGAYVASKHAVAGLTRTAAIEAAPAGVRVNAVAPGLVLTAAVDLDAEAFAAVHPIRRPVAAEEVAKVIAWLLLDAPPALTGALIPVDGGLTAQVAGAG